MQDFFVVFADFDANEPPDVFTACVAELFREQVTKMTVDKKGRKGLILEGGRPSWIREMLPMNRSASKSAIAVGRATGSGLSLTARRERCSSSMGNW
jgi:hypothetical protein